MTVLMVDLLKILVPLLLGGGTVGTWTALRKDRRDSSTHQLDIIRIMRSDTADAAAQAVEAIQRASAVEQRAAAVERRAATAEQRADTAEQRADAAERAAHTQAGEIRSLRASLQRIAGIMSREMTYILDWIDSGAQPPPPAREARIVREALADIATADPNTD